MTARQVKKIMKAGLKVLVDLSCLARVLYCRLMWLSHPQFSSTAESVSPKFTLQLNQSRFTSLRNSQLDVGSHLLDT